MPLPKVGETISIEDFNQLPEIGETISVEDFENLPGANLGDAVTAPPRSRFAQSLMSARGGLRGATENLALGVAKGVGSTIFGAGRLGETLLRGTVGRGVKALTGRPQQPRIFGEKPQVLQPETPAQKVGFLGEQIAEFLAPVGKITQVEKAATGLIKGTSLLSRAGRLGIRAGLQAGTVGGQTAIQQGEAENEAKTAALVGGLFPVAGGIVREGERVLGLGRKIAEKIENVVIRPTQADTKSGFKAENVFKYNLGGSLRQTVQKAEKTLNTLGSKLKNVIQAVHDNGQTTNVNLLSVLDDAEKAFTQGQKGKESFGSLRRLKNQFQEIKQEIEEVAGESGVVDFESAILVKRGAGHESAWAYKMPDRDAPAVERAYTAFYKALMKKTEEVALRTGNEEFIRLNKAISDIIPIQMAAVRRSPVAARNQVVGLKANIYLMASLFNPSALAVLGVDKILQSGRFAKYLASLSKEGAGQQTAPRIFGATNRPGLSAPEE